MRIGTRWHESGTEETGSRMVGSDGNPDATHVPVMAARIVSLLAPALSAPGSIYVDGTLGLGGHAALILSACPSAQLVGIDRDPAALEVARQRLCLLYTSRCV